MKHEMRTDYISKQAKSIMYILDILNYFNSTYIHTLEINTGGSDNQIQKQIYLHPLFVHSPYTNISAYCCEQQRKSRLAPSYKTINVTI